MEDDIGKQCLRFLFAVYLVSAGIAERDHRSSDSRLDRSFALDHFGQAAAAAVAVANALGRPRGSRDIIKESGHTKAVYDAIWMLPSSGLEQQ